jgi:large subunit ribosomal protein L1
MHRGKKYKSAKEKVGRGKVYKLEEAVHKLKEATFAQFDETVEMSLRLGVDPKHADQVVRGTILLPHGTGKKVRVLVLTKGEKEKEAKEAGADFVGSDEFIKKITEGWSEVDVIIATPDVMGEVGRLGKILGPKGLMPNPKSGTVTFDVAKAVREIKAGRVEYRVDKGGNIGVPIAKLSFAEDKIVENAKVFLEAVMRAKPPAAKGTYLKNASISSTMGPGVRLDTSAVSAMMKQ